MFTVDHMFAMSM